MRETFIIAFKHGSDLRKIVAYHRGETGDCADRRDAKIYQSNADACAAAAELAKTCYGRIPVVIRR